MAPIANDKARPSGNWDGPANDFDKVQKIHVPDSTSTLG